MTKTKPEYIIKKDIKNNDEFLNLLKWLAMGSVGSRVSSRLVCNGVCSILSIHQILRYLRLNVIHNEIFYQRVWGTLWRCNPWSYLVLSCSVRSYSSLSLIYCSKNSRRFKSCPSKMLTLPLFDYKLLHLSPCKKKIISRLKS